MRLNNLNVIVLLCVHLIGIGNAEAGRWKVYPNPGDTAPELIADDWLNVDRKKGFLRLSDLRGKVVVLDFWATHCSPCVKGMPHLQELYESRKSEGLVVIGLTEQEPDDKVRDLIIKLGITYPIGAGKDYDKSYRVGGIPTLFVIDRNGVVTWRSGDNVLKHKQDLEREVKKALSKK